MSDWVYTELSEAIRSLELPPGTRLSEPSLAERLRVSRVPVREAIGRLADQGLVTVVPQVGTRVAPILLSEVENACFIRGSLEAGAFARAIARPELDPDAGLTALRGILAANRAAFDAGDAAEFFATDEQLHHAVFALAGVPQVWELVRGVKVQLDRLRRLHLRHVMANREIVDEHAEIVDAIENRDAQRGQQVIARHAARIIRDAGELQAEYPEYFPA